MYLSIMLFQHTSILLKIGQLPLVPVYPKYILLIFLLHYPTNHLNNWSLVPIKQDHLNNAYSFRKEKRPAATFIPSKIFGKSKTIG